jgi:phage/plasmid-like protein (TIGR03299 family)
MSALDRKDEFTDEVFTRDRKSWWAGMSDVPGVNVCTTERLTVKEAFDRYLPWTVRKVELIDPEGVTPAGIYVHKRSDTGAVLGSSTNRFTVIQNDAAEELLTRALHGADYAVASIGALKHGAITFASVDFDEMPDINVAGQKILPFLSLVNPHDGHGSLRVYGTGIRPECMNTINLGWLAGTRLGRLSHTTNVMARVPELELAIQTYLDLVPRAETVVGRLINARLAPADLSRAIELMTPIPEARMKDGKVKNAAAITRAEARRDEIRSLVLSDDRVGYTGTAWGLFQAFSTYDQHEKGFRRTATSGVESRQGATLVEHFTGKQEANDSSLMARVLRFADVTGVKVTPAGLVAV